MQSIPFGGQHGTRAVEFQIGRNLESDVFRSTRPCLEARSSPRDSMTTTDLYGLHRNHGAFVVGLTLSSVHQDNSFEIVSPHQSANPQTLCVVEFLVATSPVTGEAAICMRGSLFHRGGRIRNSNTRRCPELPISRGFQRFTSED